MYINRKVGAIIPVLQMRVLWLGSVNEKGLSLGCKVWKWQNWEWDPCSLTPKSMFPLGHHAGLDLAFVFSQPTNQLINQLMNNHHPTNNNHLNKQSVN